MPAPFGPMTPRDSPRTNVKDTWRSAQNCSTWRREMICAIELPEGRLAAETQAVADAQVDDLDGVSRPGTGALVDVLAIT